MAAPFYHKQYDHAGHTITIQVERDADYLDLPEGGTLPLHGITTSIDSDTRPVELNPLDAYPGPPAYPSLEEKLSSLETQMEAEIDQSDELDALMASLTYTGGSEAVTGYEVTATAPGELTHMWDFDNDLDELQIENGLLPDYSDAVVIHGGALSDPIVDTGHSPGVDNYFRIRGKRTGEDWGPWAYAFATTI